MHLPEGTFPAFQAAAYTGLAATGIWWGLKDYRQRVREKRETGTMVAVMTAMVFLVSLIPIPIPLVGSSAHPGGTPLAAIILGPKLVFPSSLVALIFQAILFGEGGFTTLGANTLSMAGGGLIAWLVYRQLNKFFGYRVGAATAGFIGSLSIYLITALELSLLPATSSASFLLVFAGIFAAFLPLQLPLALLEGAFTAAVVGFIKRRRPEIWETFAHEQTLR